MKKLLLLLTFLLIPFHASADEIIADFKEESVPVVNEELRKIRDANQDVGDRVTTLEATPSVSAATQAQMETGTSTTTYVSPGRAQYHPGAAKAWCLFNGATVGTNAPTAGYNVTSVTRNGTGDYTVNFTTAFSTANYCPVVTSQNVSNPADGVGSAVHHTLAAGSYRFKNFNSVDALRDAQVISVAVFGDQ